MEKVQEKTVGQIMKERNSVRKYQVGKSIPKDTMDEILHLAGTAPSSWNLQHWKFIVVEDQNRKESLLSVANGQQQVVDASAVIIVLGDTQANKNAEKIYENAPQHVKETLIANIENAYAHVSNFDVHEAIRNASYATMQLMLAAKSFGLDTCPMGGFSPDELVKTLNIPDRYIPVIMLTIGYAATPAHPTERFPLEDIVIKETF